MASSAPVAVAAMLGLKCVNAGAVSYLDETDVQFVSGRNVVRYDTETRAQRVISGVPESVAITAVATSPNKKLTAYAEFTTARTPVITVYDWSSRRKRRTITAFEHGHAHVSYLSFTGDGRHLLVQTGAPDWTLHYVAWEKGAAGKVVATVRNVCSASRTVAQVDAHPADPGLVAACGRGFLKLFRLSTEGDALKPVALNLRREPVNFTAHAWLAESHMVIGTSGGELWVIEGGEFRRVLEPGAGGPRPIGALLPFSKGFLAGCDGGMLRVFEHADDPRLFYKLTKTFTIGGDELSRIVSLALSPNEEDLAAVCSSGQAYSFKLASYELYKPGDLAFRPLVALFHTPPAAGLEAPSSGPEASKPKPGHSTSVGGGGIPGQTDWSITPTDPWSGGAFNLGVTGLDTCVRKPIFVSAGGDRTVRIWTYAASVPSSSAAAAAAAAADGHAVASSRDGARSPGGGAKSPGDGGPSAAAYDITPTLELVQRFSEVPLSVSMHPTGLHLLVGLESSLQLMNILLDAIRPVKEFPVRGCSEVRFSRGGHMFAAANGTAVSVYGTYTAALVTNLRGHADRVVGLAWAPDDRHVLSLGREGTLVRSPVVIPNATSTTAAASSSAGGGGPAASPGGSAAAMSTASVLSGLSNASAGAGGQPILGKATHTVEFRDFIPVAVSAGHSEAGLDAYVTGVLTVRSGGGGRTGARGSMTGSVASDGGGGSNEAAGATHVCVLRHVDLTAPSRLAVKAEVVVPGHLIRTVQPAALSRLMLAGIGAPFDQPAARSTATAATGQRPESRQGQPQALGAGGRRPSLSAAAGPSYRDGLIITPLTPHQPHTGTHREPPPPGTAGGSQRERTDSVSVSESGKERDRPISPSERAPSPSHQAAAAGAAVGGPPTDLCGVLRCYRAPFEATAAGSSAATPHASPFDVVCHAAPITRLALSHDESLLITGAADGSLVLHTVNPELRAPPPGSQLAGGSGLTAGGAAAASGSSAGEERLPWAEEILVTKADLDEVRKERLELEARVQEISMTNRYNERYKDMSNEERLREVERKFAEELRADRAKHELLRDAKAEMEARYEEQLASIAAQQARELEELEATYRAKITGEMERYDALVKDRDALHEECDAANAALVRDNAAAIEKLKARFEAAVAAEEEAAAALEAAKRAAAEEHARTADAVEGDVDTEIEATRTRFERKLQAESKITAALKTENATMKRRFVSTTKEITEQKEDIATLGDREKELHDTIQALQKDITAHKKEIREREETIADKESRITDLEKKNQELEKFKFVLNYKIQELKRQIMPRKREISDMRDQMKEMELELLQYHKSNAALDLLIGELKLKRNGMQAEVTKLRSEIATRDAELEKIARDVQAVHGVIDNPKQLQSSVIRLYHKYIHGDAGTTLLPGSSGGATSGKATAAAGVDIEDVQQELARQRTHLERNADSLARQAAKEATSGGGDQARLMRENTVLAAEINELLRDLHYMQHLVASEALGGDSATSRIGTAASGGPGPGRPGVPATASSGRRTAARFGVVTGSTQL